MITHSELVESHFGYWPTFADAKVVSFAWQKAGTIEMEIHYIDAEQKKDALVSLLFTDVKDIDLTHFMDENVIDCLSISFGEQVLVDLEACYGFHGMFKCSGVEVVAVAPNKSSKPTPVRGAA